MKAKKITKQELMKKLNITSQAVSLWKKNGIPAKACIDLEPIINIRARKLYLNNHLLFDMLNNSNKASNTSSQQGTDDGKPKV